MLLQWCQENTVKHVKQVFKLDVKMKTYGVKWLWNETMVWYYGKYIKWLCDCDSS